MTSAAQSFALTYGSPSNDLIAEARKTFTGANISRLSFCTTPVKILSNGAEEAVVGNASGFFWHQDGTDWLITNWHVISGRHLFTKALAGTGLVPRKIRVHGWKLIWISGNDIQNIRSSFDYNLPDLAVERLSKPIQIEGREVDIVALPLPSGFPMQKNIPLEKAINGWGDVQGCVNQIPQDKISTEAGDECAILGYPLKNHTGLLYPIWKRGSISTDTAFALDEVPAFLVDAATSAGMSGSPVFRRVVGATVFDNASQVISEKKAYQFIGVYAGRLQSTELERINMGYVWFGSLIEAVVTKCGEMWNEVYETLQKDEAAPSTGE